MNFLDSATILQQATGQRLYDALLLQLQKDFGLANCYIDLEKSTPPEQLQKELHERVYILLMEKFTEYLNLLYVIDVPEKAFKNIKVTDAVEVAEQVAFLILKREFQKVSLKAKYS